MQHEQVDHRVWKYVEDKEMRMHWAEENRQMELGWLEVQQSDSDDLDVMGDPENYLEDGSIDDYEAGFIQGFMEA
jgi:hypothetical protein